MFVSIGVSNVKWEEVRRGKREKMKHAENDRFRRTQCTVSFIPVPNPKCVNKSVGLR